MTRELLRIQSEQRTNIVPLCLFSVVLDIAITAMTGQMTRFSEFFLGSERHAAIHDEYPLSGNHLQPHALTTGYLMGQSRFHKGIEITVQHVVR